MQTSHNSNLSAILGKLKESLGEDANCVFILQDPLYWLPEFAEEEKAKRKPVPAVLVQGITEASYSPASFASWEDWKKGKLQSGVVCGKVSKEWQDGLWEFKGVHALNASFLLSEYDDLVLAKISVILSKGDEAIRDFLSAYNFAAWRRNREDLPKVLDGDGREIDSFRHMQWESIFLPEGMTDRIRSEVENFFAGQKLYERVGLDWKRGIMLVGKPGTGKTSLVRAIASTACVPVVCCALDKPDAFDALKSVSNTIRANAPCVCVFEDADALGGNESLRSAFLNMLDGLTSASGVLTVATTNCPDKLDEALTGRPSRFDSFYVIGEPKEEQRRQILLARLGKSAKPLKEGDLEHIVNLTDGFSAASVQEVAVDALLNLVKGDQPITREALVSAVERLKAHLQIAKDGGEKALHGAMGL